MLEPEVIYEDKNFLAVNKHAGLLVHAARISADKKQRTTDKEPTLVDWLVERYPEIKNVGDDPALRPGIVHRLDKDTSGIMVVARTRESFEYLKSLFQTRQIHKTYLALVFGAVKEKSGIIEKPIGIKNGTLKRSVRSEKMGKEAITQYKLVTTYHTLPTTYLSLLEVEPKTGRTHQIRVHLASIGHPIVGDRLYGTKESRVKSQAMGARLMLHALSLEFTTVEGRRVKLEAEPPADFRGTISSIAQ